MTQPRVLVLDADGVLHPADVRVSPGRLPVFAPALQGRHTLFMHGYLLADILEPHPDVRVLLSTSWVQVFGMELLLTLLPSGIRTRVIGSCFDPERHGPGYAQVGRGYQVMEEVKRRGLQTWVALDDDERDWPEEVAGNLIVTDSLLGISAAPCREKLERWLDQTHPGRN